MDMELNVLKSEWLLAFGPQKSVDSNTIRYPDLPYVTKVQNTKLTLPNCNFIPVKGIFFDAIPL
jgi:hypothetical protein